MDGGVGDGCDDSDNVDEYDYGGWITMMVMTTIMMGWWWCWRSIGNSSGGGADDDDDYGSDDCDGDDDGRELGSRFHAASTWLYEQLSVSDEVPVCK